MNERILIDSKVINCGAKLAYLGVNIYLMNDESDNRNIFETLENLEKLKIVANGHHTKFIL